MEFAVDLVTKSVEKLHDDAKRLELEKESARSTIRDLLNHIESNQAPLSPAQRDDAKCKLRQALHRSETVHVSIKSMARNPEQIDARHKVNILLEELEKDVVRRHPYARQRVVSYMNACCSNQPAGSVAPDQQFDAALLGCSLDDQKDIRRRVEKLMDVVDNGS